MTSSHTHTHKHIHREIDITYHRYWHRMYTYTYIRKYIYIYIYIRRPYTCEKGHCRRESRVVGFLLLLLLLLAIPCTLQIRIPRDGDCYEEIKLSRLGYLNIWIYDGWTLVVIDVILISVWDGPTHKHHCCFPMISDSELCLVTARCHRQRGGRRRTDGETWSIWRIGVGKLCSERVDYIVITKCSANILQIIRIGFYLSHND